MSYWRPSQKTAKNVDHALVSKLICELSAPRVFLSDNGAEFWNRLLQEICNQFVINHTFMVPYPPASNGFVERTNRKNLGSPSSSRGLPFAQLGRLASARSCEHKFKPL